MPPSSRFIASLSPLSNKPAFRPSTSSSCFHRCTMASKAMRRGFAPLQKTDGSDNASGDKDRSESLSARPVLKGVVFDMDGTLCEPQNYMFKEMRDAVGIPAGSDILDHVHDLPADEQKVAFDKIRAIERTAMDKQVPQSGMVSLMEYLDRKGLHKGICTRNFDAPVTHLLETHLPAHVNPFSPIVTRDFRPPKPSPAGILHIAHAWGVTDSAAVPDTDPSKRQIPLIMVGDSIDDIVAGYEAGALTVLLRSEGKEELEKDERTDVVISRLDELIQLLDKGLVSSRN